MTQAVDLDAVGRTALVTAAMRATETSRPDAIYRDPYAATLAGELGPKLLAELVGAAAATCAPRPLSGPDEPMQEPAQDYNAIRARVFDDYVRAAADEAASSGTSVGDARGAGAAGAAGIARATEDAEGAVLQVVVAGAGMDSRAYRLPWRGEVRFFEIDRPAVLEYKRDRLAGAIPEVDHAAVPADLTSAKWPAALIDAGFEPDQPSSWLVEGVLSYLPEAGVHRLLEKVARLSAPGSRIAADVLNRAALTLPSQRAILDVFAGWGCPWLFGCDEPEALFGRHGFLATVVRPGDPGAEFGRWPEAVPARGVTDVRQMFFVMGRRV